MTKETGGPAFPNHTLEPNPDGGQPRIIWQEGMTLRDYFAAKAMQTIIQARTTLNEREYPDDSYTFAVSCGMNGETDLRKDGGDKYRWLELVAEEAYECADAMLKAREQ